MSSVVTWVRFGDVVEVLSVPSEIPEKFFVVHSCGILAPGYYCQTCRQHLANVGNLVMHIEPGGAHHIAVWCSTHRVYEEAPATMRESFTALLERERSDSLAPLDHSQPDRTT